MQVPVYITKADHELALDLAKRVDAMNIIDDHAASIAQGIRDNIRAHNIDITNRRKEVKEPYQIITKGIDAAAKELTDELSLILSKLDVKIAQFFEAREVERLTAQFNALKDGADTPPVLPPPPPIKTRKAKVLKITDESLIPKKYWVIDEVALRRDLEAGIKVPGAEMQEIRRLN